MYIALDKYITNAPAMPHDAGLVYFSVPSNQDDFVKLWDNVKFSSSSKQHGYRINNEYQRKKNNKIKQASRLANLCNRVTSRWSPYNSREWQNEKAQTFFRAVGRSILFTFAQEGNSTVLLLESLLHPIFQALKNEFEVNTFHNLS